MSDGAPWSLWGEIQENVARITHTATYGMCVRACEGS